MPPRTNSLVAEGIPLSTSNSGRAFRAAVELLDSLPVERSQVVVRAFTAFFHLANLSEENYRVEALHEREQGVSTDMDVDPGNELTVAYHQLVEEAGVARATELLNRLEFHPVFTAHPTEARRKAVEGKIRRISGASFRAFAPGWIGPRGKRAPPAPGD